MGTVVLIFGLALMTFGSMLLRSIRDDLGYYIPKEELEDDDAKGGKVS
jgi:cytochrome c oxidase subunit 1